MIKVFRNHVCLCTVTTAILSFLQNGIGIGASAQGDDYKISVSSIYPGQFYEISVTPVQNGVSYMSTLNLSGRRISSLNGLSSDNLGASRGDSGSGSSNSSGHLSGNNAGHILSGEGGDKSVSRYVYVKDEKVGDQPSRLMIYDGLYYMCNDCGTEKIGYQYYEITHENAKFSSNTAITVKGRDSRVDGENVTVHSQVYDKPFTRGVSVSEDGKIVLTNPTLKNVHVAFYASDGIIEVRQGTIEANHKAVEAIGNSFVVLEDTEIKTGNGKAGLLSYDRSEVWMAGGSVDFMNSHGVSSTLGGKINLDAVKITGNSKEKNSNNYAVLHTDLGGPINLDGTTINAMNVHGILSENTVRTSNSILQFGAEDSRPKISVTEVNLTSASVTVNGEASYGIYFRGEKLSERFENRENLEEEKKLPRLEAINLRQTMFSVPDSVALYSIDSTYGVVNLMQSTLSGRSLLRAERGALVKVLASASTLEGKASVDDRSTAELYLGAGSTWILKQTQETDSRESDFTNHSSVSFLLLMNDSSVNFKKLKSASTYHYQTLNIGNGMNTVYKVQDGGNIYLNTYLNEGGDREKQKTDRVLIHGDVSGTTVVHVRGMPGSSGESTGSGGNEQGISIIQVSGKANKNSFQLDGGYVTAQHSPYQYMLYAYGPESDLGEAHSNQRLVKGEGKFWDFRLENRYIDDHKPGPAPAPGPVPKPIPEPGPRPELGPSPGPFPEPTPPPRLEPGVKAVVPQVPTYLLLPNALFHAGLIDVSNQGKRLEVLRTVSGGYLQNEENPAFFVRSYGGSHRYASNLSALEYGYGGELGYNAIEAGILLKTIEGEHSNTSFGVMGTYGKLSLQPLDVEQSQKSVFDKWSVTAYSTLQHDAGFYVDGLLSYGVFKGDVHTLARGKTATLKGKPLSVSVTTGKAFVVGEEGFIFDPQVQAIYQHIQFDKARDIDDFEIALGKLDQWTMRVGGRLTKALAATEEARVVSFYGKLHLAHSFGEKQFVYFKDAFQLGGFGSSVEAGLGFNARLSSKFSLHGDLVYQQKLTKAGFSGTSFSGGLRYQF
ncbi:autotransporter outer membrane beta-barrel domain-containing protein [Bartonella koehlerae]|uniref:Outer membrane autotransporter barrel domain-containing protein n=1 Tax=Bartonella koehlerae C-29 TaxID=1134510 RepID=A0A067W2Y2_9HYPH|nr:autotransporter outer membrane beta-barrel domain-containing protein [Bartonella koehlerae]KEC54009.1 outer membrane autotransporter barrel domain-containing protein [Bartonella koehlerae C-29]KEC54782.1 outer membrane autotransporter barrel domain-containing protein [Bartonella koehlerae C-29]